MKCPTCSSELKVSKNETYRYDESGLPNTVLAGIDVRRCSNCGEVMPVIPRVAELHQLMANLVIRKKSRLLGAEIRFLRKYLGHSTEDFADVIGINRSTLSRWENDKEHPGATADRLLRLLVVNEKRVEGYAVKEFSSIGDDASAPPLVRFEKKNSRWEHAEAHP